MMRFVSGLAVVLSLLMFFTAGASKSDTACDRDPIAFVEFRTPTTELGAFKESLSLFASHNNLHIKIFPGFYPTDVSVLIWRDDLDMSAASYPPETEAEIVISFAFYLPCGGKPVADEEVGRLVDGLLGDLAPVKGLSIKRKNVPARP